MRDRKLLHHADVPAFAAWCVELGWIEEPTQGNYEVLRMRHPDLRDRLFVHSRVQATEHVTVWGISRELAHRFVRRKRV